MKHIIQPLLALLVFSIGMGSAFAQHKGDSHSHDRVCHTMGNLDRLLQKHHNMANRMGNIETKTPSCVNTMKQNPSQRSQMMVTIPVVFHILYNTDAENISDAQVLSASDFERRLSTFECESGQRLASVRTRKLNFVLPPKTPREIRPMGFCGFRRTSGPLVPTTP